jgi:hypothetical protein
VTGGRKEGTRDEGVGTSKIKKESLRAEPLANPFHNLPLP